MMQLKHTLVAHTCWSHTKHALSWSKHPVALAAVAAALPVELLLGRLVQRQSLLCCAATLLKKAAGFHMDSPVGELSAVRCSADA